MGKEDRGVIWGIKMTEYKIAVNLYNREENPTTFQTERTYSAQEIYALAESLKIQGKEMNLTFQAFHELLKTPIEINWGSLHTVILNRGLGSEITKENFNEFAASILEDLVEESFRKVPELVK